jgi:protein ImuB
MLWIGLYLPSLSLESFVATLADDDARRPVALIDEHRISVANAAAAQGGIKPGMKRATALALAPDLVLGQADARRDADALLAVAQATLMFTPMVALEGQQAVVLEVQSTLRVFGGLDALLRKLRATLQPLGHACRIACAPTALGAALLAQWRDGLHEGAHVRRIDALRALLDTAPVWLLGPGREHWQALQGMGLATLADLRQLPRSGLARRFGEGLLADLDRALGQRPDPREPITLPPVFDRRLELFARVDCS